MPAKKKTSARKTSARKTSAKKTSAKKTSAKKTSAKRPATKRPATKTASGSAKSSTPGAGDLIVIDSPKVGSPPREGEVLEVIQGEIRVSYRVRWPDGHESLIAPDSGITRILPGSRKR
jgi:Domain of unknown function (DUF1918)